MIQKYHIQGMTCNGCRKKVEDLLTEMNGVIKATVDLDNKEAIIEMKQHVVIQELQNALPNKYHISEKQIFSDSTIESVVEKSVLQQLFPLFLIFGYIVVASLLLNYNPFSTSGFMLDFMGLFYIVFSFFKLLDLKGFPKSFMMYDPLAAIVPLYAWVYPFIEIVLGIQFLMRFKIGIALVVTILILGITTLGVIKVLLDKKIIQCACLGTALKLPMTKATFIENSIMLIMAIWMLVKLYT